MIYRTKRSRCWYVKLQRDGVLVHKSTGMVDRADAETVEKAIEMSMGKRVPLESMLNTIRALYGCDKSKLQPLKNIWSVYQKYLKNSNKSLSGNTVTRRMNIVASFLDWCECNHVAIKTIDAVGRRCASDFVSYAGSGRSSKTIANIVGNMSAVWSGVMRVDESVRDNPWSKQSPEVITSRRRNSFSREQIAAIMETCERAGHDWKTACMIALYTGLRWGDVTHLRWENIDMKEKLIRLTPSKTAKNKISVIIPIHASLWKEIAWRKSKAGYILDSYLRTASDRGNTRGKPQKWRFSRILHEAGIIGGYYDFHSWRHTFRTMMSEAGVSKDLAKKLGGWTVDRTAERYDHAENIDQLREAVDRISI